MPVIEVENLSYGYSKGTPFEISALNNVSFSVEKGELVGIIGHTGSGKSTLMQMLNALLTPDSGRVLLDGHDINADKKSRREARFKVGLCFQYPEYQLFEETCFKDISFGPGNMGLSSDEITKRVLSAAALAGLDKSLLDKSPFDLSGGQKRRAAIAGVMAMQPEVLILDEPTAGLDPAGTRSMMDMICSYREKTGATVLMVTHNMEIIAGRADRLLVMNNSRLAYFDTPEKVFSHSREIAEMGLNVPAVTGILNSLKAAGLDVDTSCYTTEAAAKELCAFLKKEGLA